LQALVLLGCRKFRKIPTTQITTSYASCARKGRGL